jgi:DNA-dependent protein kinase catalytic subunit
LNPYLYITKEEVESNLASNERFATTGNASSWVFGYGADKPSSGTGKDLVTTANEYRPEHSMAMQANIQVRILRFLGKLGGANSKVISDVEGQSRGVAWDSTPRVSLDLAYQGGVLNMFMDDILPSLCHLATTSSSRQTKIAACEFVHAICLNITNQDDGKGVFEQIYSKLFPLVIQLSTDVEKITRQLFEPLTSHLIKWSILTGNDKATNVLLSSLTDSLSSETDGALRSFSASSLTHFLKLYFELKRGKQSLITLFSLLPSLACHPNPYKRLGSVLAFKQLCTVMHRHRNDPHFDHSMIQLLEIMNSMFSALHLTKPEHQSIGIEGLALQVIEQLGSLIEHFAEALFPHGLSHFVTFLFVTYCGHVRRPVRVCSQALFEKLLKLLPHNPTPTQWLKNRMTGNGAIYDVFDRALPNTPSKPRNSTGGSQSLTMEPSPGASQDSLEPGLDDQNFSFKTEKQVSLSVFEAEELAKLLEKAIAQQKIGSLDGIECQRWFSGLSAWLDSLIWLLSNNIIQVGELTNPARLNPIFQHATLFLKVYAMMDLSTGYFATMTPQELEAHTQARCTTTLSIYALASVLLDKGSLNLIQDVLYRSLIVSMLAPHLLGFPLYNAQDQRRIRKATTKLVSSIVRNLSNCASSNVAGQEAYNRFNTCTSGVINRAELNIANLTFTAGQIDIEKMRHIAVGIYDLNRSGILAQRYKTYLQLATHLFQQVAANHASCTPLELSALRKIIKLALVLPFEPSLLLDYLKDTSAVSAQDQSRMAVDDPSGKKRQLTKGELFYTHFKSHIDEYFIQNVEKVLGPLLTLASTSHPQLFKIVLAVLDLQLSNVRHARIPPHKVDLAIEALSGNFFASWIAADAPFDQRDCMLEYVKKISAMNATQHIKNAKMIDFVVRTFESFMAKDQPLWFKVRVLSLLPLLLPHLPAVYIPRLIKPVEIMIIFDFPSKSSLLTPDSAAYSEYIGALDSLLSTLSTTHSIDLLEALFPLLNDNKHVHMLQIDKALETFVKGCKPESYSRLFTVCFQAFLEATPNLETLRLALIRKVCVPFMLSAKPSSLMDIMKQEATRIFGIVFPVLPEITSPKADSKPPIVDRITVVTRIGAFHLIQAIFSAVSHQDRDHLNSIILTPKDVKAGSLSQKAMRCSFAVRNKKHAEFASDVSFDVQLEYQRAAYHCLSTVLMKAQPSNIKFFEVFGFTEDVKKGDLLWEHIVDLESKFTFSVETHFPIANKQVSAIYSKASQKHVEPQYAKSSTSMVATGAITGTLNPRRYLTSSYFVDSSLSQEAADSAFFLSPEMPPANGNDNAMEVDDSDGLDLHALDEQPSQSASVTTPNAGEIELDPLNTNPCMFNMLDMIDDLNIKFGDQLAATGVMPVWMTEVFNKLERADTHINVKLFITKLIMNKPEAFENYAKDWFGPLCRVLFHNVDTVGNPGFNYFVRDLCIVFLKWPKFTPQLAEHKMLAGQFMEHLMRNATHSSRRVITSNLQIIKLLVERWRDCLVDKVPRKLITDLLTLERKSTLASRFYRLVGIQILGCIVSNKLGLWNDTNFGNGNPAMAVNRRAFMEGIVALLSYGYREVYQAAGELIGLAFLYQSPGADDTLQQMVVEKMTVMFNSEELSKFVAVLERMSRHYPVIVDTFIERLLVSLKKLGDDKVKALEIALLRIAEMNDPYAAMVSNLESLLRHRDDATQLATLNILHVIYRTIPTKDIQNLIPILTASFADHLNENVRSRYLELLMQIFDDARPELENDDPLRLGLLKGLADQNSDISGALFDFWDRDGRLPTQPSARLQQLMVKFYHPDVETHWLKMSSHLMMRLFQNHKAYEAVVSTLAHGTEGADITLDDSSAMVGIMEPSAATYVKQTLSDSQMMDSIERTSPAKKVKDAFTKYHTLYFETVNSAPPPPEKTSLRPAPRPIEPTQGGFKTPTKPGTKVKTESTEKSVPYGSPVSLMPPPKTPPRRIPSNNPSVPASPSSSLAIFDNDIGLTGVAGEANRVRITRRFANSPIASMGSSHFFRQRELAMRKQREANARELARKRLHHVQLYRTYAGGVKTISNKDIIDPLIAVALRNDSIARLVLSILVNSMRDLIDTAMLQTTLGNLLESSHSGSLHTDTSLPSSAQQVISSSISTPFINCLLRIAHDHPTLIVPSRLIADCSIKSLNFHLGIITLEKQVMKYETLLSATPAARGRGRITDSVSSPLIDDTWAQLVRLYKIIDEEDVLRGLYEKPSLTTRRDVKSALAAELEGEFEEAHARYFEILKAQSNRGVKGVAMAVDSGNDSCTENELDLCNAGQLNSLAKLSEWKQLSELVYQHLSKDPDTGMHRGPPTLDEVRPIEGSKEDPLPGLWAPANREKYMKYFLDSCLMERDRWEFLFKWVDAVQDKRSSLEGEFSSQLAYLSTLRNDVGRADSYVRQAFRHFLGSWSVLPPSMATAAQLKLLQSLQPLLELEEFLTFTTNPDNFESLDATYKILELWRHRYPSQRLDDFEVWDRVGRQRAQFLNLICTHYIEYQELQKQVKQQQESTTSSEKQPVDLNFLKKVLKADRDHLFIRMAIAARKQSRLSTSDKILAGIETKLPKGRPVSFQVFFPRLKTDLVTIRHAHGLSGNAASHSIAPASTELLSSYSSLWERIGERESILSPEQLEHRSKLNLVKSSLVLDILDMQTAHPTQFSTSWKYMTSEARKPLSFVQEGTLKEVGRAAFESIFESAAADSRLMAKTHFKFSRFCDKVASTQNGQVKHQYSLDAVKHMFKAIILNHQEAIGSVPLLLRILSSYRSSSSSSSTSSKGSSSSSVGSAMKHIGEQFNTLGREIPVWIWLRWLNQLIGLMDHPEFVFILPLLERVAEAYPQSLYYHFRISTDKDYGTRPVESRLRKLQHLLHNDLLDKFVYAMQQLTNPEHRAKDWMSAMNVHYQNAPLLNKLYRAFVEDCLLVTADTGDLNRQFASKISGRDVRDRGGEGMQPVDRELIQRVHKAVNEAAGTFTAISDKANTLAHYTKWLDGYTSALGMRTGEIEIPGQYGGLHKPQPEAHVKVSSFDKSLLIMTSMRRPKRLKIRGTDEKEYWFLVKGGEDLRQDQRVEQLFAICNHLFANEVETSKRNLSVHTYHVIPMTTRAGILEWIRNTAPLKAVVDAHSHSGFKTCVEEHDKFLGRTAKFKGPIQELYKTAFKSRGYDEVSQKLQRQHELLPGDLLRSKIIALSADPEAFIGIRQKAATSIAVFSVVSYIIGIGDRHLDNFLINMKDGEFIGIDFGYAFDAATLLLPIPELVPFRLTRQLTELLKPLDTDGLLKLTMVHALTALVRNRHLLLDAMDLFVNEPLLDWSMWANKLPGKPSIETYTRDRLRTVEQKLSLVDPGYITSQLLKVSIHHADEYCDNLVKIVSPKGAQGRQCASVKAQVERLIEQATNPHILGMAWSGWCPWV